MASWSGACNVSGRRAWSERRRFGALRRADVSRFRLTWRLAAVIALLGVMLPSTHLLAQSVRGATTRNGIPVIGVVIQLLDSANVAVVRTLSDQMGDYRLLAPRAGRYRLSARRIGYAPVLSPVFELRDGETREQPIALNSLAIALDTVKVRARTACERMNASDADAILVWEQARTAIMATQATLDGGVMSATLLNYHRTRAPDGTSTLESLNLTEVDSAGQLWTSPSAKELARSGYIVQSGDSTNFRAPALDVMASDEFASGYCYRVTPSADSATVAVSFEPAKPNKNIAELRGVITLDKTSAALRSFDFQYTNIAKQLEDAGAGGRMEFVALRDGGWVISRWVIRMPFLLRRAERLGRTVRVVETVSNVDVGGGDLLVARRGADTLFARVIPPVNGVVLDSATNAVIAGARLRLRGTDRATQTDSVGRFTFARLMPGDYTMLVNTPSLDSVGALTAVPLLVTDSLAAVSVRVTNAQRVLPAVCRTPADSMAIVLSRALLRGTVRFLPDSALPNGISVLVQWKDATNETKVQRAHADELGRYRICGVPMARWLEVRAEAEAMSSAVATVQLDSVSSFGQVDLVLERPRATEAVVTGLVMDSLNTPLEGVTVEFPTLNLRTATDARGEFRMPGVAPGTQLLTFRRLGFAPLDKSLKLAAGDVVRQSFVLSPVRTIAGVTTTANRAWLKDFEENRKLGLGQFRTEQELQQKQMLRMSALLSEFRGARLITPPGSKKTFLSSSRGERSMSSGTCYAQIYLDDTPLYSGRNGEPVPDINELLISQYEAVEWYAGASETPSKYTNLNSGCGVLVLHTR